VDNDEWAGDHISENQC
jgi:hypothetical protein